MKNMFDLSGKFALVTGGAGDLGYAMAEGLYEQGSEVMLWDLSDRVEEYAARLQKASGPAAHGKKIDLSDRAEINSAIDEIESRFGHIDILLNAAGIQRRYEVENFPEEEWDKVIDVNLSSMFFICKKVGSIMKKQGKGKIINIASMLTFFGGKYVAAYAASKGGVGQLTKALTNEWMEYGINVNAIAPGFMKTIMNRAYFEREDYKPLYEQITSRIPAGRWGLPDDMQGAAIFLASPAFDFISGVIIPVDGGYMVR